MGIKETRTKCKRPMGDRIDELKDAIDRALDEVRRIYAVEGRSNAYATAIDKLIKAKKELAAHELKLEKDREEALHKIPKVRCTSNPLEALIGAKFEKLKEHRGHSSDRLDIHLDNDRVLSYHFSQDGKIGVTILESTGYTTNWDFGSTPTVWCNI